MKETYISSDKETIGSIFSSNSSYKVPLYQRSFSWDDDEIEQLWLDILETITLGKKEYFLGSIVVVLKDGNMKEIIDGQQRLASLSVLLCVLHGFLKENDDKDRASQIDLHLGKRDFRTQDILPRLSLNEIDGPFFRNNILSNNGVADIKSATDNKTLPKSNRLLAKSYIEFRNHIEKAVSSSSESFLYDLYECIIDKLCVIEISVTDEADAYALFETLNDRGIDLSISDLLKNFVFSKAGTRITEIKKNWDEISLLLINRGLPQFLRHHWISKNGLVREKELYRKVRDSYRNTRDIRPFVSELRKVAEVYSSFRQPDSEIWDNYGTQVRNHLANLRLFRVVQCFPLLLAAYGELNKKLFTCVLKMAVVISFRYSIICGKQTGLLERVYGDVSVKIRKGKLTKAKDIFNGLAQLYPDDKEFKLAFSKKSIKNAKLARYILLQLESQLNKSLSYEPSGDEKRVNLEHIFPKNPDKNWLAKLNGEELEDYVNLLGNLTLLPVNINRSIGSELFTHKCKRAYKKSDLELTKSILSFSDWGPEEISERQSYLANLAVKVWRLNY